MGSRINRLLQKMPEGAVVLASWLTNNGYSHSLQQRYLQSNWLEPIARGVYKRKGDTVDVFGAIYAIQQLSGKEIHIGGRSALELQGFSHYLNLKEAGITVITAPGNKVPQWLLKNPLFQSPVVRQMSFLPPNAGVISIPEKSFFINVSSPTRAMLECLELAPRHFDLNEAWLIMEGLTSMKPEKVQDLLEQSTSVKANRLFLYMSKKAGHPWFRHLNIKNIYLGKGKRSIVKGGVWIPSFQITVPESIT